MAFYFADLDENVRALMLEEVEFDEANNTLHISPYLSGQGVRDYPQLLKEAIQNGDEETLAQALSQHRRIDRTAHRRNPAGGYSIVTVPENAAEMLAGDAFNRYYIRALCQRALQEGIDELIIYRAKPAANPRAASEQLVETTIDPQTLLLDLRKYTDERPEFGIPGGPNSGLSVRLPRPLKDE